MKVHVVLIILGMLLYLPLGLLGADYVAGAMFSVTNKQMPDAVSLATCSADTADSASIT